ncbi:unnamed protein product, partial [Rotaria sp. Silwood1]
MSSSTYDQCHMCEDELGDTDDVIITECNHKFHRHCAQKRFDTKHKSDCYVCHKDSAISDALSRVMKTQITKSTKKIDDSSEYMNPDDDYIPALDSENSINTNEKLWECERCSVSNTESIKRCQNCGKLCYSLPSIFRETIDNDECNDSSPTKQFTLVSITPIISTSDTTRGTIKQDLKSSTEYKEQKQSSSTESNIIVYITDLPANIDNDDNLAKLIQNHLENIHKITPISIKCYSELAAGFIYVGDNQTKTCLIDKIKRMVLDSTGDTSIISFNDTLELISYIVIDKTNEKKDVNLPESHEILNRWIDLYHGEKPRSCEQISAQFPNIYRLISTSLDDLLNVMSNRDFLINNLIARVYVGANCSYFEDLPRSTNKEQLERTICISIGITNVESLSLHIELNKQTRNACIIAAGIARKWATKDFLYVNGKPIPIKVNLAFRLLLHPISKLYKDDEILSQKIFRGQAKILERCGDKITLEISSKTIFDECLKFGVLRIGTDSVLKLENYISIMDPEELEIDVETWYENEMIRYKPDIMQFINDLEHPIFRYKWNAQIWLEQFQNIMYSDSITNIDSRHHSNLSSDKIRHLFQMTVMLNTIGVIRKKNYFIKNEQINLNLDPKLKTIIYNHDSLLEHGQTVQLTTTPYTETKVKVINEDCLTVYGNCCKDYKKPLLLNMANATSPGGALGCGAFRNPPEHVAKIFRSVIEQYAGFFQTIIFAILDDHNTGQQHNPEGNFKSFRNELHDQIFRPILSLNRANTIIGPYRISSDASTINDVTIFDLQPCPLGAKCNKMYDSKHTLKYSHPALCNELCATERCQQTDNLVHMSSFIHRNPCKNGTQCKDIDDEKHSREYEHPSCCPNGANCQDTSNNHEQAYRHLPLCENFRKCPQFQKRVKSHCEQFRHCNPSCKLGNKCIYFHNKQHIENYKHPFPSPCPFTPYHCAFYEKFTTIKSNETIPIDIDQHRLDFAHVCHIGQNCTDKDPLHWEKSIHVPRSICKFGYQCTKLVQEDHLNSYTHSKINDIRFLCTDADKCQKRKDLRHLSTVRHIITFEDSGIVRYFNLNKDIDFVQNQHDNIERVINYIKKEKWETFKSGSIPQNIIDWICTAQPVHRCRREIFESILLHGHVMSRDYMENLKKSECVINSILQHSQLRRIQCLREENYAKDIKEYVTALVLDEFERKHSQKNSDEIVERSASSFPDILNPQFRELFIKNKEGFFSHVLSENDIKTIKTKAIEIAQASIKLHSNPAGIGYERDKDLGTHKNVFSVLGPHTGDYGDVFIVFKREILHHPDSNFSIQSATSYVSGRAFKWRPWLGEDPGSKNDRIKLYHNTKLHAAITGYEYATALELIATFGRKIKSMNIDLDTILRDSVTRDSHMNIEAHLPQLIPLDYIDHIYLPKQIFDTFSTETRQAINTIFHNRISIKSFSLIDEYRSIVIKDIIEKYGQRDIH